MSNESADRETIWDRVIPWVVKLLLWAFYAWLAWSIWKPIQGAPVWAQAVAGGVLAVGYFVWAISKELEKQQKQLNRIEAMLRRLPGTTSSAYDDY